MLVTVPRIRKRNSGVIIRDHEAEAYAVMHGLQFASDMGFRQGYAR